jgi:pimeloyl-ACP methyl ester carboxylesterase
VGSPITVGELDAAQPELFAQAAQAWNQSVAAAFGEQVVAFSQYAFAPISQGTWIGGAADAASQKLTAVQGDLSATEEYMVAFADLLQTAADGITEAQATLRAARVIATQNQLTIDDSGAVTVSASVAGNRVMINQLQTYSTTAVLEVQSLVSAALADAERVVSTLVPKLRNPEQFGISSAAGSWEADAVTQLAAAQAQTRTLEQAAIPARGATPVEVAAWWQAQSTAEQVTLTRAFPGLIGRLDGIPAYVRDRANRLVLAQEINADTTQIAALRAEQSSLQSEVNQLAAIAPAGGLNSGQQLRPDQIQAAYALQQAQQQLDGINANLASVSTRLGALSGLEAKLGEGGTQTFFNNRLLTMPQMYLLGFDTDGVGHAIVACGDPDTARNVAVYVPGLNTSLSTHFDQADIGHDQNMTLQANQDTGTDSNASIIWLGYNPPQAQVPGIYHVAGTGDAAAAVPALTNCLAGLRAVNTEIDNLTLVGHSYGSLVVGETAKQSRLPVDNIVLIGSPGVSVYHAADLNIPASHVWAGEAANDPVGQFRWFSNAPTDPDFGANQFVVAAGDTTPLGTGLNAHGEYFNENSQSLKNIASIITGQYGNVTLDHAWDSPVPLVPSQLPSPPSPYQQPRIANPMPLPDPAP